MIKRSQEGSGREPGKPHKDADRNREEAIRFLKERPNKFYRICVDSEYIQLSVHEYQDPRIILIDFHRNYDDFIKRLKLAEKKIEKIAESVEFVEEDPFLAMNWEKIIKPKIYREE